MDKDLSRLEKLYNCRFYKLKQGKQDFIELYTKNKFSKDNINHIKHLLKQYGYYFYTIEAIFDDMIITFYRK